MTLGRCRALPWAGMLRPFRAKKIVQLFCVAPLTIHMIGKTEVGL